jgi:ribosomal protein S14
MSDVRDTEVMRDAARELAKAGERIAELEAALRYIRDSTCCDGCGEASKVARDALKLSKIQL